MFLPIMDIALIISELSSQMIQHRNIAVACVSQWKRIVSRPCESRKGREKHCRKVKVIDATDGPQIFF